MGFNQYNKEQNQNQAQKVELSQKKKQQLNNMPIIKTNVKLSKTGEYVVHETIITDIKPIAYWKKVLDVDKQ